ncbi:seryl-tRNA synthetase [Erysipelotrichaceae bacterium]|nr:seryl-tRNA synthetase [Erysipelotrichaceae bacterium]
MLNIQLIRDERERVKKKLQEKGENTEVIDEIYCLDEEYRKYIMEADELKNKRNNTSKKIGELKRNKEDTTAVMAMVEEIGEQIKEKDKLITVLKDKIFNALAVLPNITDESVPYGVSEAENIEIHKWETPTTFPFEPQAHWDLVENLGIVDFERAAKITGSRFSIYRGQGAKLVRALINFMLDTHEKAGYEEMMTPAIVNESSLFATGNFPKFKEDVFKVEAEKNYYLIPTAEVTLTAMMKDEIIPTADFPIKRTAYTPCFRSEAGSAGRDTRGLIRQHQFDKVELVHMTTKENSFIELEELREEAERILKLLKLPFRTIVLCTGDTGFSSAKTYDLEVWLPSYNAYKEISSCSNCTDFQGRRANIRYRDEDNKTQYAHTLNGSGLAIGRTFAAIIENYQNEDGTVTIPEVLIPYMNGIKIIQK